MADDLFTRSGVSVPSPKLPAVQRYQAAMSEIVDVIGEEKAAELSAKLGGVNQRARDIRALIVEAIGREAGEALVAYFDVSHIYIPRNLLSPDARAAKVMELRGKGLTITQIALEAKVTERQVYKILEKHRTAR